MEDDVIICWLSLLTVVVVSQLIVSMFRSVHDSHVVELMIQHGKELERRRPERLCVGGCTGTTEQ